MASIRDVAQKAGVGVGTVSRVINGSGYVAEKTREKIENAIHELEYTPNELARNLFKNRTGIIGVLVPDMDHPFFLRLQERRRLLSIIMTEARRQLLLSIRLRQQKELLLQQRERQRSTLKNMLFLFNI